jgi:hypothetical protein
LLPNLFGTRTISSICVAWMAEQKNGSRSPDDPRRCQLNGRSAAMGTAASRRSVRERYGSFPGGRRQGGARLLRCRARRALRHGRGRRPGGTRRRGSGASRNTRRHGTISAVKSCGSRFLRAMSARLAWHSAHEAEEGISRITLVVYLNHDFQGGATVFPELDMTISPRRSRSNRARPRTR